MPITESGTEHMNISQKDRRHAHSTHKHASQEQYPRIVNIHT